MIKILVITDKTQQEIQEICGNKVDRIILQNINITLHYYNPKGMPAYRRYCGAEFDTIVCEGKPEVTYHDIEYLATRLKSAENTSVIKILKDIWIERWEQNK